MFEAEPQSDEDGATGVCLGHIRGVGALEGFDALLRVCAPPSRLAETDEVIAGQFLEIGERCEAFVRLPPVVPFQSRASAIETHSVRHRTTLFMMARLIGPATLAK